MSKEIEEKLKRERLERIIKRKEEIGSQLDRKLQRYSEKFERMFEFFRASYAAGILDFCGSSVVVKHDPDGHDAKFAFREFDNGRFGIGDIISSEPELLRSVIIGKKAWGLWLKEWSQGISEGTFTEREILKTFADAGIEIPEAFMKEWDNLMLKVALPSEARRKIMERFSTMDL